MNENGNNIRHNPQITEASALMIVRDEIHNSMDTMRKLIEVQFEEMGKRLDDSVAMSNRNNIDSLSRIKTHDARLCTIEKWINTVSGAAKMSAYIGAALCTLAGAIVLLT